MSTQQVNGNLLLLALWFGKKTVILLYMEWNTTSKMAALLSRKRGITLSIQRYTLQRNTTFPFYIRLLEPQNVTLMSWCFCSQENTTLSQPKMLEQIVISEVCSTFLKMMLYLSGLIIPKSYDPLQLKTTLVPIWCSQNGINKVTDCYQLTLLVQCYVCTPTFFFNINTIACFLLLL